MAVATNSGQYNSQIMDILTFSKTLIITVSLIKTNYCSPVFVIQFIMFSDTYITYRNQNCLFCLCIQS